MPAPADMTRGRVPDGLWPILDECPAPRHNSMRAATGRSKARGEGQEGEPFHPPCICPRALELKRVESDRKNAMKRYRRDAHISSYAYRENVKTDVVTDSFPTNGACQSAEGRAAMDAYFDQPGDRRSLILRIKAMCDRCPAATLAACETWVRAKEKTPGAWPGVYAGRTPAERAREWGTG